MGTSYDSHDTYYSGSIHNDYHKKFRTLNPVQNDFEIYQDKMTKDYSENAARAFNELIHANFKKTELNQVLMQGTSFDISGSRLEILVKIHDVIRVMAKQLQDKAAEYQHDLTSVSFDPIAITNYVDDLKKVIVGDAPLSKTLTAAAFTSLYSIVERLTTKKTEPYTEASSITNVGSGIKLLTYAVTKLQTEKKDNDKSSKEFYLSMFKFELIYNKELLAKNSIIVELENLMNNMADACKQIELLNSCIEHEEKTDEENAIIALAQKVAGKYLAEVQAANVSLQEQLKKVEEVESKSTVQS